MASSKCGEFMVAHRRWLQGTTLVLFLAILATSSVALTQDDASEPAPPLELRITVDKGDHWDPKWVFIGWELVNVSSGPVYVCQWPGPAFSHGWEYPEGEYNGTVPGYP